MDNYNTISKILNFIETPDIQSILNIIINNPSLINDTDIMKTITNKVITLQQMKNIISESLLNYKPLKKEMTEEEYIREVKKYLYLIKLKNNWISEDENWRLLKKTGKYTLKKDEFIFENSISELDINNEDLNDYLVKICKVLANISNYTVKCSFYKGKNKLTWIGIKFKKNK